MLDYLKYISPVAYLGGSAVNAINNRPGLGPDQQNGIYQNKPQVGNWDWLFGTPAQNISNLDPRQQPLQQSLGMQGLYNTQNPYAGFEPIRQSALTTFNQDIVPGLTSMFNRGTGSSHFGSGTLATQLSGAGATLAERLAAAQAQYGQTNQNLGLRQLQTALNPHLEYSKRQPGFAEELALKLAEILPMFARGG